MDRNKIEFSKFFVTGQYAVAQPVTLENYNVDDAPATVSIRFNGLIDEIASRVSESDVVVGCCPWMSSSRMTSALLSNDKQFSIITSWETGERPPATHFHRFPVEVGVRLQYDNVSLAPIDWETVGGFEFIESVQGNPATNARQRLHSKFLVFLKHETIDGRRRLVPQEFVLGSANWTDNADLQYEVLCFIKSKEAARSMLLQWYQMLMLALYERDSNLLRLSPLSQMVDDHCQRNGIAEFYSNDMESALFEYDDYFNGKR